MLFCPDFCDFGTAKVKLHRASLSLQPFVRPNAHSALETVKTPVTGQGSDFSGCETPVG